MITEVYINDQLIDIDQEETVTASYGNISFGEFQKRKGVKSNTWKAPFSIRNKMVFESCEVPGSYSVIPYRKSSIRVEIYGVVVFEGFCIVEEAKDAYEIISFAGASDFYDTINKRKLDELDLSDYNHSWNEGVIRTSWANTQGYIYAYVHYRRFQSDEILPEILLPQIFFHTIVKQIATDAGYTLSGNVLTDPKFLKHIIVANRFPLPIIYGGDMILNYVLPDVVQSKVWLDFANMYGLQFDIDDNLKTIRANYIDDLLFNEPEDWSAKVDRSEKVRTSYTLDYGQKSYLRYNTDDVLLEGLEKEIVIDDHTLDFEKDIYKSAFFVGQSQEFTDKIYTDTFVIKDDKGYDFVWDAVTTFSATANVRWNGSFYTALQTNSNQEPPNATYWKPIKEADLYTIKSRPLYGTLVTNVVSAYEVVFPGGNESITKIINRDGLSWEEIYTNRYRVFSRIIDRTKKIQIAVKLNYADINQLDFTKLKRIDGELYVLEEVVQFKLNKTDSTLCNLIRL